MCCLVNKDSLQRIFDLKHCSEVAVQFACHVKGRFLERRKAYPVVYKTALMGFVVACKRLSTLCALW